MKKLLSLITLIGVITFSSCKYDDDDLWSSLHGLEDRVAKLEELCKQMNTNVSSLQTIVTALQENDYVTSIAPVMKDGKEIGYTITFNKSNPITIYHGKDGQDGNDGKDGTTPSISVNQDVDGMYYWTLNGEWLTDSNGNKINAQGKVGQSAYELAVENGYQGSLSEWLASLNGDNGVDGKSAYELAVENGYQGSLNEWLESLKGINGADGKSAYELAVEKGYSGSIEDWLASLNGTNGTNGKSAYELAVEKGYLGTLDEWIESLKGSNGTNGITPQFKIGEDNYWYVSYDNKISWISLNVKATGDGGMGDEIFKDITQDEENVYFILNDDKDTIITISKSEQKPFSLTIQCEDSEVFEYEEVRAFPITQINVSEITILCADGWRASIKGENLSIEAPQYDNYLAQENGKISLIAVSEDGRVAISKIGVQIQSNYVRIPDDAFRSYCLSEFDTNKDNKISKVEAAEVVEISPASGNGEGWNSFDGIEYFTGLKKFYCHSSNAMSLDLSNCTQLESVSCFKGKLSFLNVRNCSKLTLLVCSENQISDLDLSDNTQLTEIICSDNNLTNLDLSAQPNLESVDCINNKIDKILINPNMSVTPGEPHFIQIDKEAGTKVYQNGELVKYKVGDYNSGVVFYTENGFSGKVIWSMGSYANEYAWSTDSFKIGANSVSDGELNMQRICAIDGWEKLYPAVGFIDRFLSTESWYLPAKDELALIFVDDTLETIRSALGEVGSALELQSGLYWSSTESDDGQSAWVYDVSRKSLATASKTTKCQTLAIMKF